MPRRPSSTLPPAPATDALRSLAPLTAAERRQRLTRAEEHQLGTLALAGDLAARDRLIEANLALVAACTRKFERDGIQREDLIGQGYLGLIRAAEKYDPEKGFAFGVYAPFWIDRFCREYLARMGAIAALPLYRADSYVRVQRARQVLMQELTREPTYEEIAYVAGTTEKDVKEALQYQAAPASIDAPVGDESGGATMGDYLRDDHSVSPHDRVEQRELRRRVEDALGLLPEREALVVSYYYGLRGLPERNLEQIGDVLGITRERVRQLKEKAHERLRQSWLAADHDSDA